MKGNDRIIETLNDLLADELSAINQYMVHSEMCENWGYERLHKLVEKRAFTEMRHAEKIIERILFLDGKPVVSVLHGIHIGPFVDQQFTNDLASEKAVLAKYNASIHLANEVSDAGTRELIESIVEDEERHIDQIESQQDEIEHLGIQNYLAEQIRKEASS